MFSASFGRRNVQIILVCVPGTTYLVLRVAPPDGDKWASTELKSYTKLREIANSDDITQESHPELAHSGPGARLTLGVWHLCARPAVILRYVDLVIFLHTSPLMKTSSLRELRTNMCLYHDGRGRRSSSTNTRYHAHQTIPRSATLVKNNQINQ